MKKIIITILLSILATNSLAATTSPDKLSVILDWYLNPDHAPLIVAQQQGFFKEKHLDVELINPADPNDPPKMVSAKKADIGITYEPEFMEQVDQGLPVIRIGTLIDKPLDCVVALKESGINKITDLKGKRIGVGSSGISNIMIKVLLEKAGLKESDVQLINVRYNLTQALMSHQIDAVAGLMRNVEVPPLESSNHKLTVFFPEENGIPNYSVLIFVAHQNNIKDTRLPRFLAAIKKAVRYIDEHPTETWKTFAKQYPESNNEVNREAWLATMPYFAEDPASFEAEEWQKFAAFMLKNKMIKTVQPMSRYAVVLR